MRAGGGRLVLVHWLTVSAVTLLYWVASHALRPMVALHLDAIGSSDLFIGVAIAVFPFFALLLAIPGGGLVDRFGTVRVLRISFPCMALVGVGYAYAGGQYHVLLLQAVCGLVELALWVSLQSLITHVPGTASRHRHLSLFAFVWGAGGAFGPAFGAWLYDTAGFHALALTYALLAALAAGMAPLLPRVPDDREHGSEADAVPRGGLRQARMMWSRPAMRLLVMASFLALYLGSLKISFYPLFLQRSGYSVTQVGALLMAIGVASLVVRLPLFWLMARVRTEVLLVAGLAAATLALCVTPLWPGLPWLYGAAVVYGLAHGTNPPLTVELIARSTRPRERGVGVGMRVSANRLAQVLQPLAFSAYATVVGMRGAFLASGLVLGGLTVWMGRNAGRASSTASAPAPEP